MLLCVAFSVMTVLQSPSAHNLDLPVVLGMSLAEFVLVAIYAGLVIKSSGKSPSDKSPVTDDQGPHNFEVQILNFGVPQQRPRKPYVHFATEDIVEYNVDSYKKELNANEAKFMKKASQLGARLLPFDLAEFNEVDISIDPLVNEQRTTRFFITPTAEKELNLISQKYLQEVPLSEESVFGRQEVKNLLGNLRIYRVGNDIIFYVGSGDSYKIDRYVKRLRGYGSGIGTLTEDYKEKWNELCALAKDISMIKSSTKPNYMVTRSATGRRIAIGEGKNAEKDKVLSLLVAEFDRLRTDLEKLRSLYIPQVDISKFEGVKESIAESKAQDLFKFLCTSVEEKRFSFKSSNILDCYFPVAPICERP